MIQHSADFWNFDLRSRFEVRNGYWGQPNGKASNSNVGRILKLWSARSEMDFELNVMQKHHDFNVGWFVKVWSARSEMDFELNLMQQHHDSIVRRFWNFVQRSRFEVRNGFWAQRIQNHHDSTFGRFLKVWFAIEIWNQKWILRST